MGKRALCWNGLLIRDDIWWMFLRKQSGSEFCRKSLGYQQVGSLRKSGGFHSTLVVNLSFQVLGKYSHKGGC